MKKAIIILAICIALLTCGAGIVAWLSRQPQTWYAQQNIITPELETLTERAEYRLTEEFHKIRPEDETWKLRINDALINAWLATRLEDWLTHEQDAEMPPEIHDPQVHVTPEGVWFAAMVEIEQDDPRPIALQLAMRIEDGMFVVEPVAIRLGKVPIPVTVFKQAIEDTRNEVFAVDATAPLMDDRVVDIRSITLEDGALVLACQTHLPK